MCTQGASVEGDTVQLPPHSLGRLSSVAGAWSLRLRHSKLNFALFIDGGSLCERQEQRYRRLLLRMHIKI